MPQTSEHKQWSFSLAFGVHRPVLEDLHEGLFEAPVSGEGGIIIDPVTEQQETVGFSFDEPLSGTRNGGKAAFELQWHPNPRHALIMGVGSWETSATVLQSGSMPSQGVMNEVNFERRATISYAEYSLGWRYTFWQRKKFSMYSRVSIHEIFDIDYREDFIFQYLSGSDLAGFQRIHILEAQTASLAMGQLGVGGEWFLQKWFSLAMEAGYLVGERSAQLQDVRVKTDFLARDNVRINGLPFGVTADGKLSYLSPDSTADAPDYRRLRLNFSGWQVLLRMNIYY